MKDMKSMKVREEVPRSEVGKEKMGNRVQRFSVPRSKVQRFFNPER